MHSDILEFLTINRHKDTSPSTKKYFQNSVANGNEYIFHPTSFILQWEINWLVHPRNKRFSKPFFHTLYPTLILVYHLITSNRIEESTHSSPFVLWFPPVQCSFMMRQFTVQTYRNIPTTIFFIFLSNENSLNQTFFISYQPRKGPSEKQEGSGSEAIQWALVA